MLIYELRVLSHPIPELVHEIAYYEFYVCIMWLYAYIVSSYANIARNYH